MKVNIDVSTEERQELFRWAMKTGRYNFWNEKGAFCSSKAATYIFQRGMAAAKKEYDE